MIALEGKTLGRKFRVARPKFSTLREHDELAKFKDR